MYLFNQAAYATSRSDFHNVDFPFRWANRNEVWTAPPFSNFKLGRDESFPVCDEAIHNRFFV